MKEKTMKEHRSTYNKDRDYRETEEIELKKSFIVSGYATTFDRYPLYEEDGITTYEQIDRNAFNDTDMGDVILQYDHSGRVFARNNNKTLILEVDDKGLKIFADLSKTEASREMHNEIKEAMVTKMSWAFSIEEEEFDRETRTRVITKVKKIYDCSFVSRPANENTSITLLEQPQTEELPHERSARTYVEAINGEIEQRELDKAKAERIERVNQAYFNTLKRIKEMDNKTSEMDNKTSNGLGGNIPWL